MPAEPGSPGQKGFGGQGGPGAPGTPGQPGVGGNTNPAIPEQNEVDAGPNATFIALSKGKPCSLRT